MYSIVNSKCTIIHINRAVVINNVINPLLAEKNVLNVGKKQHDSGTLYTVPGTHNVAFQCRLPP